MSEERRGPRGLSDSQVAELEKVSRPLREVMTETSEENFEECMRSLRDYHRMQATEMFIRAYLAQQIAKAREEGIVEGFAAGRLCKDDGPQHAPGELVHDSVDDFLKTRGEK